MRSESSILSQYFFTTRIKTQVPVRILVYDGEGPELHNALCFTELRSNQ